MRRERELGDGLKEKTRPWKWTLFDCSKGRSVDQNMVRFFGYPHSSVLTSAKSDVQFLYFVALLFIKIISG